MSEKKPQQTELGLSKLPKKKGLLGSITELQSLSSMTEDALMSAKAQNQLAIILNQQPNATWVKVHPFAKTMVNGVSQPYRYVPRGVVEQLLTFIYTDWRIEIREVKQVLNSMVVTVRLHTLNPVTGEWGYQDGVGAAAIQMDAGANATDLSKIKTAAIQMCTPAAETYAMKDAADKLGRIFGKDLNIEQVDYTPLETKFVND